MNTFYTTKNVWVFILWNLQGGAKWINIFKGDVMTSSLIIIEGKMFSESGKNSFKSTINRGFKEKACIARNPKNRSSPALNISYCFQLVSYFYGHPFKVFSSSPCIFLSDLWSLKVQTPAACFAPTAPVIKLTFLVWALN